MTFVILLLCWQTNGSRVGLCWQIYRIFCWRHSVGRAVQRTNTNDGQNITSNRSLVSVDEQKPMVLTIVRPPVRSGMEDDVLQWHSVFGSGLVSDQAAKFRGKNTEGENSPSSSKPMYFYNFPVMPFASVGMPQCFQYGTKSSSKSYFFSRAPLWPERDEFSSNAMSGGRLLRHWCESSRWLGEWTMLDRAIPATPHTSQLS